MRKRAIEAKNIREAKKADLMLEDWRRAPAPGVKNSAFGEWHELDSARDGSEKRGISKGLNPDNVVYLTINGQVTSYRLESKTNGGRIDNIRRQYEATIKDGIPRFVNYRLNVQNANTHYELIDFPAKLFPVAVFWKALESIGNYSVKRTPLRYGGAVNGYGINPTHKKFIAFIESWPIEYHKEKIYSMDEFGRI